MAVFEQQTGSQVDGGDLPFKNYGGSAIAAGLAVKLDTGTVPSGTNPAGVVVTTSSVGAIGVTMESIPAGKMGRVRCYGVAPATAGGTIAVGDYVMAANTGVVVTQTAGLFGLGYALSGAASTETVRVLLALAKNA
jgi:Uncharacterized conserved protein (DUF2190)